MGETDGSITAALQEATRNGRVCPLPDSWNKLWELLPGRRRVGAGWEPPLPLILGAWNHASPQEKQLRLREHLEWAAKHGALGPVVQFMRTLDEAAWLHHGE